MLGYTNFQLGKATYYLRNREKSKFYFNEGLEFEAYLSSYYVNKLKQYIATIELEIAQLNRANYSPSSYEQELRAIGEVYSEILDLYKSEIKSTRDSGF